MMALGQAEVFSLLLFFTRKGDLSKGRVKEKNESEKKARPANHYVYFWPLPMLSLLLLSLSFCSLSRSLPLCFLLPCF